MNTEIKIRKNVPIPQRHFRGFYDVAMKKLQIGDSFEAKGTKKTRAVFYNCAKRIGIVITIRIVEDVISVWRVK